ncbi:CPXCG motif-containing cysteine-rich protein [Lysobacter niastensis]|uniref:CPXCG motif-containing cysteine-rich protein n=1 Tax=Lysobacter niastensis TaxID=380629 RepID=A0ABS0B7N5_9GAMM|nr:CPXCG motif-containing cysteine-rich protein [Lysobacter niastensis]MBF6025010.1 CPXCG motif-containing cysteine-rich protein [Lysobacter niastensis]
MLPFATVVCPYCGESIDLEVDVSGGGQRYVEDCQVCCRPIVVMLDVDDEGMPSVDVAREDEA